MATQFNQTDVRWKGPPSDSESLQVRDLKLGYGVVLALKMKGVIVLHGLLYKDLPDSFKNWRESGVRAFKWFPARVFAELRLQDDFEMPDCVGNCGPGVGCGQPLCFCHEGKCTPMALLIS